MEIYATKMSQDEKDKLMEFQNIKSIEEAVHEEFKVGLGDSFNAIISHHEVKEITKRFMISTPLAFQLYTLVAINAHQYFGSPQSYSTTLSTSDLKGNSNSALFYVASKMTHSCRPNCCYTSKSTEGHLVYYAVQPITEGDLLTFSYIEDTYASTSQRRSKLVLSKDFRCMCIKCTSFDYSDGYFCMNHSICHGITFPCLVLPKDSDWDGDGDGDGDGDESDAVQWNCNKCTDTRSRRPVGAIKKAAIIFASFSSSKPELMTPTYHKEVIRMLNQLKKYVHKNNHMLIEMELYLATVYASDANSWRKVGNHRMYEQSTLLSSETLQSAISRIECSEAQCQLQHCNETHTHGQVGSICHYVLWACLDLISIGRTIPSNLSRYILFLERCYGKTDADVLSIKLSSCLL
jgi:hypothetical protein